LEQVSRSSGGKGEGGATGEDQHIIVGGQGGLRPRKKERKAPQRKAKTERKKKEDGPGNSQTLQGTALAR